MGFLSKLGGKVVWQKCPLSEKKGAIFLYSQHPKIFFILNSAFWLKWNYFLLVPSVDIIETKNGEDIFIINAILGQISSVTEMSPAYFFVYLQHCTDSFLFR